MGRRPKDVAEKANLGKEEIELLPKKMGDYTFTTSGYPFTFDIKRNDKKLGTIFFSNKPVMKDGVEIGNRVLLMNMAREQVAYKNVDVFKASEKDVITILDEQWKVVNVKEKKKNAT